MPVADGALALPGATIAEAGRCTDRERTPELPRALRRGGQRFEQVVLADGSRFEQLQAGRRIPADEYEHQDSTLFAREQPIMLVITTASAAPAIS